MTDLYADLRPAEPRKDLPIPHRVLAVGAHPDDVEFGAGGTLARWARMGAAITILVLTDGSKGTWDPSADLGELIRARRREAAEAAAVLGAGSVEFGDATDGELETTRAAVEHVARGIRRLRPDAVLTHDPWQRYQLHPDHRAAGWIVVDAVVAARDPHFLPHLLEEGLEPHRPSALLLWSADEPNHWEDIDATCGAKVQALLCHASQRATTMGLRSSDGPERDAFAARIAAWAEREGRAGGLRAAESFRRIMP